MSSNRIIINIEKKTNVLDLIQVSDIYTSLIKDFKFNNTRVGLVTVKYKTDIPKDLLITGVNTQNQNIEIYFFLPSSKRGYIYSLQVFCKGSYTEDLDFLDFKLKY